MIQCFHHLIHLSIGDFHLAEIRGQLCALTTAAQLPTLQQHLRRFIPEELCLTERMTPTLQLTQNQLEEYFSGIRQTFQLPINLYGTEFQKAVWLQLQRIPYGSTTTYGQIAAQLKQKGARAVGTAVGKNPLPIIIPCHRVLPQNGHLGHFSMHGGPQTKAFLLDLEETEYIK